jgi:hypothetical protein
VICRVGDRTCTGRALDLPAGVDPARLVRAVRTGDATETEPPIRVVARTAGRLHERVGHVHGDLTIRPRTALAVAARTRGWRTAYDAPLRDAREALAAQDVPEVEPAVEPHRELAETRGERDRMRERVATARGRVQAAPGEATAEREELASAIRDLSEVETSVAAARERRRRDREAADVARDHLQERLRLADRVANLERRARRALVDRARSPYASALAAVPGVAPDSLPFEAAPDAMALAIARFGEPRAPLVLSTGRFSDAAAAATWLATPVLRLES